LKIGDRITTSGIQKWVYDKFEFFYKAELNTKERKAFKEIIPIILTSLGVDYEKKDS
jgi:hypothetical protein